LQERAATAQAEIKGEQETRVAETRANSEARVNTLKEYMR
jgi:hypothetical protein